MRKQKVKEASVGQFPAIVAAMTNPRKADRYPHEYFDMLERIDSEPTLQIQIECTDEKKAMGLRKRFYDFRDAVLADQSWERFHYAANRMMIRLEGSTLVLLHRDHSAEAAQMREALAKLPKKGKQ